MHFWGTLLELCPLELSRNPPSSCYWEGSHQRHSATELPGVGGVLEKTAGHWAPHSAGAGRWGGPTFCPNLLPETRRMPPPALSLQCPFLANLNIAPAGKGEVKGTDSLSQNKQLRVNSELESNKLITGTVGKTRST